METDKKSLTPKEKYNKMKAFIDYQNLEWEKHCVDIGLIGRILEKIFGSSFAHYQRMEFNEFCENLDK